MALGCIVRMAMPAAEIVVTEDAFAVFDHSQIHTLITRIEEHIEWIEGRWCFWHVSHVIRTKRTIVPGPAAAISEPLSDSGDSLTLRPTARAYEQNARDRKGTGHYTEQSGSRCAQCWRRCGGSGTRGEAAVCGVTVARAHVAFQRA